MKKRTIFLVDMNAFFVSCEMSRNPELVGRPAAVAGSPERRSGVILAANYEARKYGVQSAMVISKATKLCPDIVFVPPDHSFYRQKSRDVMDLLSNYTPLLQQNSIDEAWLDMTGTEKLFGPSPGVAEKVMNDIKTNLGLWCSIGISNNKFLSKMAADMKKPLGITQLWQSDIQRKMWPLPIEKMHGIGEKTANKLYTLGIRTIGELANFDEKYLYRFFGKSGREIYQHANGIDLSPVERNNSDNIKSIGRSTTLPRDITDMEILKKILVELSEDIGMTARKHNKKGNTISIVIKYSDFESVTRQTKLPPTYFTKDIYDAGVNLLINNLSPKKSVRLIGITLKGFEEEPSLEQLSFFHTNSNQNNKSEKIDKVMDTIRAKYGQDKIVRASLLDSKKDE